MSRPFKLYRLQQIDTHQDWLRTRLKEIETGLADAEALNNARMQNEAAEVELQKARLTLRNTEFETQQQRIKIEQTEAALYGGKVRNPKELQDLQNEAAALKRFLSVLEERQFEAMLSEEDAAARSEESNTNLNTVSQAHANRLQDLSDEKEKLQKDLARTNGEREATIAAIAPEDYHLYQQLREKRRGIAVAKVVERACSACGSTLNAALLSTAHSPNQLTLCDACGRVLYVG